MNGNNGRPQQPKSKSGWLLGVIVGLFAAALLVGAVMKPHAAEKPVAFSEFLNQVRKDQVDHVQIMTASQAVVGELNDGTAFRTTYPLDYQLTDKLEAADVPFVVQSARGSSANSLLILGAVALFAGLLFFLHRQRTAGGKAAGNAPGRMIAAGEVPVSFRDVAGCDEVITELAEIKEFLADPERFRKLGATIPKGVLLFGPPGTGKTLLARAVAGEAGVPFFSISGSDFVEMYVGVGASRVRKLFETAKAQAPCVIFIDEIDAVGRRRGGSAQGGQEERENTLNQLLVEMDGFAPTDNVILMAASNRADVLDPALTRPGRFDRQVIVDIPDRAGRREILSVHSKGKPFHGEVDLATVAAQTAGFSGADLSNLLNEAALLAARNGRDEIGQHDLDEATLRVMAGPQKNRVMSAQEKLVTAAHEMGHAIVAHELDDAEPVHKVTIVGRGRALGLTVMLQEEDKLLRSRSELKAQMAMALGGRIAEEIMFGEITTGASNDLEKVAAIARTMVMKFGMSDELGLRAMGQEDAPPMSDELASTVDSEIDAIIAEARLQAQTILLDNREALEKITDLLIEKETIDRAEFEQLMRQAKSGDLPEPQRVSHGTSPAADLVAGVYRDDEDDEISESIFAA